MPSEVRPVADRPQKNTQHSRSLGQQCCRDAPLLCYPRRRKPPHTISDNGGSVSYVAPSIFHRNLSRRNRNRQKPANLLGFRRDGRSSTSSEAASEPLSC